MHDWGENDPDESTLTLKLSTPPRHAKAAWKTWKRGMCEIAHNVILMRGTARLLRSSRNIFPHRLESQPHWTNQISEVILVISIPHFLHLHSFQYLTWKSSFIARNYVTCTNRATAAQSMIHSDHSCYQCFQQSCKDRVSIIALLLTLWMRS